MKIRPKAGPLSFVGGILLGIGGAGASAIINGQSDAPLHTHLVVAGVGFAFFIAAMWREVKE